MSNRILKLNCKCVSCGTNTEVKVNHNQYLKYQGGELIQNAFPEMHPMLRDVIVTGMCLDCLSSTFNRPKPDEDWGEEQAECECCGAPLWKRNETAKGGYECPFCHSITTKGG